MTPIPWQPSTFLHSSQEKELWNAILSYRDHPLTPEGWHASFTFSAIEPPDLKTPALLIKPDKGPCFAAVVNSFPFAEMFGVDLEMNEMHKLPQALRNCLEEGIVSTLWHAIPDNRMGRAQIIATGKLERIIHQVTERELQWLSISIEGVTPELAAVSIGLSVADYVSVIAGDSFAPAAVDKGLTDMLQTEACYTLGSLPITFDELATLEPGDVVVLPELPADLVLLRSQGRSYAFRFMNENWVCLGGEITERYRPTLNTIERRNAMSNEDAPLPDHDPSEESLVQDLRELSVVIDFDLGRMSIPLAQVQTWQHGVVIPLEPPSLNDGVEVTIRANGQIIGIGDIVRVDNRVGVRITRLMSKN